MKKNIFMSAIKIFIIGIISIVLVFFAILSLPWLLFEVLAPNPPAPEVTYGEFPFSFVYEIDGERVEIKDTLVIEHKGVDYNEGMGKYNKWKTYYKNSLDDVYTQYGYAIEIYTGDVEGLISPTYIYFIIGNCEYYMGLPQREYTDTYPGQYFIYYYEEDDSSPNGLRSVCRFITEEELYEYCGIRIIEKSISDPIT